MGPTVVLRSRSSQALAVAMVAVSVLALATTVFDGKDAVLQYSGVSVLFGFLGWAAFWQPHVTVSDGGVEIANTLRTFDVPWPAIEGVDGRYGLRLRTAYGPVVAWGADAPVGRKRTAGVSSQAARAVSERLETLRAAGYLADPRLERPEPRITWHVSVIAVVAILVVVSLTLPMLA
jgi:hypothetical protein